MRSSISISSLRNINLRALEYFHPSEEEWDYLIILDAMRYDYFAYLWIWHEHTKPYYSLGSCTLDFLQALRPLNMPCFTSHPFVLGAKGRFRELIDCGWNNYLGTALPEYITHAFLGLGKPKPTVLWYLQPHHPYIGGFRVPVPIWRGLKMVPQKDTSRLLEQLKRDGLLLRAYEDNARYIIHHIYFKLLPHLQGRIIITSDHGEGLGEPYQSGEKPVFSHPCGSGSSELRIVPVLRLLRR